MGCFEFYPLTNGWRTRRPAICFKPHTHPFARLQGGSLTRAYIHTSIHPYVQIYKHTYKHTNLQIHTWINIYIPTHIHVCMHAYTREHPLNFWWAHIHAEKHRVVMQVWIASTNSMASLKLSLWSSPTNLECCMPWSASSTGPSASTSMHI